MELEVGLKYMMEYGLAKRRGDIGIRDTMKRDLRLGTAVRKCQKNLIWNQSQDWSGKQNKDQTWEPFKQLWRLTFQETFICHPPPCHLPMDLCNTGSVCVADRQSLFLKLLPIGVSFLWAHPCTSPESLKNSPQPSGTLVLWSENSESLNLPGCLYA